MYPTFSYFTSWTPHSWCAGGWITWVLWNQLTDGKLHHLKV